MEFVAVVQAVADGVARGAAVVFGLEAVGVEVARVGHGGRAVGRDGGCGGAVRAALDRGVAGAEAAFGGWLVEM